MVKSYLQSTVLIAGDLVVAVAVTIKGSEHDTEGPSPLAEEDEEMVSQGLLREEKSPVVDCKDVGERKRWYRKIMQDKDLNLHRCDFFYQWPQTPAEISVAEQHY